VFPRIFIYFVLLLHASNVFADAPSSDDVMQLVKQAESQNLAQHPHWLALMHYKRSAQEQNSRLQSEVISPEFFLAPSGATDSSAELAATIAAFFKPVNQDPNTHAQCRFIARYQWLHKTLNWEGLAPPAVACKNFNEWQKNGHVESLSLVFATGYLSNPASFYGHILLKFNSDKAIIKSDLFNESLNFGAIVPDNENGLVYVVKGLFGGYDASFSNARFYQQNHLYAENELRDLWEYELALSKSEVDQIVAHSWELTRTKFTYYFLEKNCAYSMAELLELVIGEPLLPKTPWSIPINVFNRLQALKRNGAPVVSKVRLIPSRLNSYHARYAALNPQQKSHLKELANNSLDFDLPNYRQLAETEKIAITETLIDYYEYRIIQDTDSLPLKKAKLQTLIERGKLASEQFSGAESAPKASEVRPPHEGTKPSMVRISALDNSHFGRGVELRFRPTYFDLLSLDAGRTANSHLTMFDFKTVYANNKLSLRSLDLVNIETLNIAQTPLSGDGGWAWKLKSGFDSQDLACRNCMTFNVTGGLGKAMQIAQQVSLYGMVDLFGQTPHQGSGTLGVVPRLGLVTSPLPGWKTNLTAGDKRYFNGQHSSNRFYRWENRLGNQRDWDVRISYEKQTVRELQIGVSTYW
jgi:Domain of unknown function (DUF4105)